MAPWQWAERAVTLTNGIAEVISIVSPEFGADLFCVSLMEETTVGAAWFRKSQSL